jgi:hypothetical protein
MEDSEELTPQERDAERISSGDSAEVVGASAPPEGMSARKWRIHLEASRRLAAMGGAMPDLEDIRRLRVDELYSLAAFVPRRTAQAVWRHFHAAQPSG